MVGGIPLRIVVPGSFSKKKNSTAYKDPMKSRCSVVQVATTRNPEEVKLAHSGCLRQEVSGALKFLVDLFVQNRTLEMN
jgi:hypothetical protein